MEFGDLFSRTMAAQEGSADSELKSTSLPEKDIRENATDIRTCQTNSVVIYLDRAEVNKAMKSQIKKGENEVILTNLSQYIDKDSIRVDGKGLATILEVSFQSKFLTSEEVTSQNVQQEELKLQLNQAVRRRAELTTKKHRLKKQRDVLDGFADALMKGSPKQENNHGIVLDGCMLEGMSGFFDLYDLRAGQLDEGLHSVSADLTRVNEEIETMEANLKQLNVSSERKEARELSILLEGKENGNVDLFISYVVTKAKWSPKYDIRVFNKDQAMKIMYYGMVQQNTGEDWDDTKLYLSTAMPSVGGMVPDLGTQTLNFKPKPLETIVQMESDTGQHGPPVTRGKSFKKSKKTRLVSVPSIDESGSTPIPYNDEALKELEMSRWFKEDNPDISFVPTEVRESITSTMYEIARRCTIASDNAAHKVSVAIIDLKPTFEYECVPRRSAHAYLKARVRNESPYALLAGPTNIFLNNSFIAKAELKAVSPAEDFTCSLGVDPAIRVDYKPIQKYREHTGIISKNISTTYRQVIELKNTHDEQVNILVLDQLPLSMEEKIKVLLVEPTIKHPEKHDKTKPIRLNKQNNVEWDLELSGGELRELMLKYTIEFPTNETLDTNVLHSTTPSTTSDA